LGLEDDFDAFVRVNGPSLLRTAWLLTGEWPAAEDLVQSALERAWPRWSKLAGEQYRCAYVRRMVTTTFLRAQRRRWRGELPWSAPPVDGPSRSEPDGFARVDVRVGLLTAVQRLPPRQRAVVAWRFFADLTESQTAQVMGCGVGTVKSYTHRALTALRAQPEVAGLLDDGSSDDRS
jgi:RNA polymerase sigma-70 factor (sigma-E family)